MNKLKLTTTNKITVILAIAIMVCGFDASAQSIEAFRIRVNHFESYKQNGHFSNFFKQLGTAENSFFYIGKWRGLFMFDNDGNELILDYGQPGSPNPIVQDNFGVKRHFYGYSSFFGKHCIYNHKGIFVFDNPGDNKISEYYGKYYDPETFININISEEFSSLPFIRLFDRDFPTLSAENLLKEVYSVLGVNTSNINGDTTNYVYYKLYDNLIKLTSRVDSNTAKIVPITVPTMGGTSIQPHNNATILHYDSIKGEIWNTSATWGSIWRINAITDETIAFYESEEFPLNTRKPPDADMRDVSIEGMVLMPDDNGDLFPVALLSNQQWTQDKFGFEKHGASKSFLMFLKDGEWDTVRIEFDDPNYWMKDRSYADKIFKWPLEGKSIVAMSYQYHRAAEGVSDSYNNVDFFRAILLYDFDTKEFSNFVLPKELFIEEHTPVPNWEGGSHATAGYFTLRDIREIINEQGEKCIGLLYSTGKIIEYNPAKVSIEDTESLNFARLWFRELFPNPATHGTVTANIMCYVSDISTVELGLYDFMGKKVLDLSNHFEYEQATRTIRTTFDIPKSLAKGSYFIVVRSGKETRTQGIIVK